MTSVSETSRHNADTSHAFLSSDDIHYEIRPGSSITSRSRSSIVQGLTHIFSRTFLPVGYPNSVRPEYLTYQFYDSLQGLCSYLRSVLTTQSVLVGAGVGSTDKTAMAAALVWIVKDGVGMMSSLLFAYFYTDYFEVNVKEFRLLADVLNNMALIVNMLVSVFPQQFLTLSCISASCSALCGLVAGATKARISAHFARDGHLADITAKESTQETAVTLVGLVLGYVCAKAIGQDSKLSWVVFTLLLCIHQIANYILMRVLVLDTLNPQRSWILMRLAVSNDDDSDGDAGVTAYEMVAKLETLSRPIYLAFYGPLIGVSIELVTSSLAYISEVNKTREPISLQRIVRATEGLPFIFGYTLKGRLVICLQQGCSEMMETKAYFVGLYMQNLYPSYTSYSLLHVSKPDLLLRFVSLLENDVSNALAWYDKTFSEASFSKQGWDVGTQKSRFGTDQWRYAAVIALNKKES